MNENVKKGLHSLTQSCVKLTKVCAITTVCVFFVGLTSALVHDFAGRKGKEENTQVQNNKKH